MLPSKESLLRGLLHSAGERWGFGDSFDYKVDEEGFRDPTPSVKFRLSTLIVGSIAVNGHMQKGCLGRLTARTELGTLLAAMRNLANTLLLPNLISLRTQEAARFFSPCETTLNDIRGAQLFPQAPFFYARSDLDVMAHQDEDPSRCQPA
jgi:hypothetical protein